MKIDMGLLLESKHYVIKILGEKEPDLIITWMETVVFFKLSRKCFH